MPKLALASGVTSFLILILYLILDSKFNFDISHTSQKVLILLSLGLLIYFAWIYSNYFGLKIFSNWAGLLQKPMMWTYLIQPAIMGVIVLLYFLALSVTLIVFKV